MAATPATSVMIDIIDQHDVPAVHPENPLENQPDQEQLDDRADRGDQQPPLQSEPEQHRDRTVDQDQERGQRDLEVRELEVGPWPFQVPPDSSSPVEGQTPSGHAKCLFQVVADPDQGPLVGWAASQPSSKALDGLGRLRSSEAVGSSSSRTDGSS